MKTYYIYNVKVANSLPEIFKGFCQVILNEIGKTLVLEYDVTKRRLSVLLGCNYTFVVAQD